MIILFLLLAVCSFLLGFILGAFKKPQVKTPNIKVFESDDSTTQKEYENFLNYDGTMQE